MYPHPHVVKRDAHFAVEVVVEERDLSVPLTEVIQHDEFSVHLHPHADSLRRGAGKGFRFKQRSIDNHATSSEKTNALNLSLNFNLHNKWHQKRLHGHHWSAQISTADSQVYKVWNTNLQICEFQLIKLNRTFTDVDDTLRPLRQSIPHWNPNESPTKSPINSTQKFSSYSALQLEKAPAWHTEQFIQRPGVPELQQTIRNPINAHLRGESQNLKRDLL